MECKHKHGDHVSTYWLCGQCYSKLHDRPVKYKMKRQQFDVYSASDITRSSEPLRQVAIYSPIKVADSGLTLSGFVKKIAARLVVQTRGYMSMVDATDYAVSLLEFIDEEFAAPGFDWSTSGAWEIVGEDMQYWDTEDSASN